MMVIEKKDISKFVPHTENKAVPWQEEFYFPNARPTSPVPPCWVDFMSKSESCLCREYGSHRDSTGRWQAERKLTWLSPPCLRPLKEFSSGLFCPFWSIFSLPPGYFILKPQSDDSKLPLGAFKDSLKVHGRSPSCDLAGRSLQGVSAAFSPRPSSLVPTASGGDRKKPLL